MTIGSCPFLKQESRVDTLVLLHLTPWLFWLISLTWHIFHRVKCEARHTKVTLEYMTATLLSHGLLILFITHGTFFRDPRRALGGIGVWHIYGSLYIPYLYYHAPAWMTVTMVFTASCVECFCQYQRDLVLCLKLWTNKQPHRWSNCDFDPVPCHL